MEQPFRLSLQFPHQVLILTLPLPRAVAWHKAFGLTNVTVKVILSNGIFPLTNLPLYFVIIVAAAVQISAETESFWDDKSIEHIHNDTGHYVRCRTCLKYPDIMKLYAYNQQIPPIATVAGARYRKTILQNHFAQNYHKESVKVERMKLLQVSTPAAATTPMAVAMNKANKKQANHVGKLLIQIYTDAKRLTLSAWNWPIRYVAAEASHAFSIDKPVNNENQSIIPDNLSLQYITPRSHLELMSCIVESDVNVLKMKIDQSMAMSLRIDGSVDRTQMDKIYVLAKIVTSGGALELVFLGVSEQVERFAAGLLKTALEAIENQFGREFLYTVILKKVSSICTDGTNVNSGEVGGIWALLENEIAKNGSDIPLTKVWCAAHRSDLAFKDLESEVPETDKILSVFSRISSYFHTSTVRSVELKKAASGIGLKLFSMPKIFDVRWTQYSYQLVRAIARNWHALVLYFREEGSAQSKGFLTFLTNEANMKKAAILGDVLMIFQRLQKKLQSNSQTLLKMTADANSAIGSLEKLKQQSIPTGFESKLRNKIQDVDGKPFLNGIELNTIVSTRRGTLPSATETFRIDVIDTLVELLRARLHQENQELLSALEAFCKFDDVAAINKVHEIVGKDLDLAALYLQYSDFITARNITILPLQKIVHHFALPDQIVHFRELATILARIVACTPHSADVERCISANNLLKTSIRSNLAITTENKYLYICFNMPALENWTPERAITKWMSTTRRQSAKTAETKSSKRQAYFKGVFESCDCEGDEDKGDESDSELQMNFDLF